MDLLTGLLAPLLGSEPLHGSMGLLAPLSLCEPVSLRKGLLDEGQS